MSLRSEVVDDGFGCLSERCGGRSMEPSVRVSRVDVTTPALFLLGATVTAVFSGSLDIPALNADLPEVLAVGMIVPSFTWLVQLSSSWLLMNRDLRHHYWAALGRACFIGSIALLPAAVANLAIPGISPWVSAMNVIVSVSLMAVDLVRQCRRNQISHRWPISWCLTIALNMTLFVWVSRNWWTGS